MTELWAFLSESSLLWLTVTLVIYVAAWQLCKVTGQAALLNPVLTGALAIILILYLSKTTYQTYFEGAQFIHFLLGPATVGLAIPLYSQRARLKQLLIPILLATLVGATVGILSAVVLGQLFGLGELTLRSIAAKSVTTPIAMGITEKLAGLPSLTATIVVFTGVVGAMFAVPLLNLLRISDEAARGLAIGVSAHGVGTARAFQLNARCGAFSGLAIALCGAVTAVLMPIFAWAIGWI